AVRAAAGGASAAETRRPAATAAGGRRRDSDAGGAGPLTRRGVRGRSPPPRPLPHPLALRRRAEDGCGDNRSEPIGARGATSAGPARLEGPDRELRKRENSRKRERDASREDDAMSAAWYNIDQRPHCLEATNLAHPRITSEEIDRRGKALYEQSIRPQVETEANAGKL